MKILHTSDWHLGAYVGPQCDDPYKRMESTTKCLDVIVKTAESDKPDIILITGDLFHTARVWSDRAIAEIKVAADYINKLATCAPVAVLYGTPNHDGAAQFEALGKMIRMDLPYAVRFFTEPSLETFITSSGPLQVAGLPGFDKGIFRSKFPGLTAEEENRIFTEQLDLILQGLNANLEKTCPSVLLAHHTVIGCELDNGTHVFQANEVVLNLASLQATSFDLVCLGHIHRSQMLENCSIPAFYAGSVDSTNFNDESHEKGFWIHNLDEGISFNRHLLSEFIRTPHRRFLTARWAQEAVQMYNEIGISGFGNFEQIEDKVVRVLYTCDSVSEKALDKKKLERDLLAAGVYYVSEIRPERVEASVNRETMTEKLTVIDCLKRYLEEKKIPDAEIILQEAIPLIQEAEASTIAGGQNGLFLPLEISVKNYRSYAEETFSFMDIYFAMVNGVNGCGKSSFFMDAPSDCLFEEPREGDLTGWIRAGQKSGSISFTFMLGQDTWRVTRTRTRSGKGTLALAKLVSLENQWEDHSCSKMDDTKKKIVELLGMDCNTFQSCVLIMQNKYGLFLEAQSEDRMAILANLLGLGIYEQLESITEKKRLEVSRQQKSAMEDNAKLLESVELKDTLLNEKEAELLKLKVLDDELAEKAKMEKDIESTIAELERIQDESRRLGDEIRTFEVQRQQKQSLLDDLSKKYETTVNFLATEEWLTSQHELYIEKSKQLSTLAGKKEVKESKAESITDKALRLGIVKREAVKVAGEIDKINGILADRPRVIAFLEENEGLEALLEAKRESKKEHDELVSEIKELTYKMNSKIDEQVSAEVRLSEQIEIITSKIKMLHESNCINSENATCKFLADAIKAREELPLIKERGVEEIASLSEAAMELEDHIASKTFDLEEIGYDDAQLLDLMEKKQQYDNMKIQMASIEAQSQNLDSLQARLNQLEKEKESLQAAVVSETIELDRLIKECEQYDDLQTEVESLKASEEKYHRIPSGKEYLESIEPQIKMLHDEIEELAEAVDWRNFRIADMQEGKPDVDSIRLQHEKVGAEITAVKLQHSTINRMIGVIEEKLQRIAENEVLATESRLKINKLATAVSIYQVLQNAFAQDGIPHQIMRDIIPELEANANDILSQMTGGWMRVDFRTEKVIKSNKAKEVPTLDVVTTDALNGEMPYLSRSGGQRTRINLAVGFALAIIKASRVGLQLGMLFVDEPSWLDEKGTEEYCAALQAIHNKYPEMRIVAISHDASMKASFPQQLWVEMTEEGSKVRRG